MSKLRAGVEMAQAFIAAAQERQEEQYNRGSDSQPRYCVGDFVWLDLRDMKSREPS